jgi:hypothetical protein
MMPAFGAIPVLTQQPGEPFRLDPVWGIEVVGNEDGVQRLESQVVAEIRGVTVTILGVQSTPHFTRVEIRVNNGTSSSMSLPLFHNATLTARTEPPSTPIPSAAAGSRRSLPEESGREPSTLRASCLKAQRLCR